jgi:hypothetical protein
MACVGVSVMFTCYLGHPWCNKCVKPFTEEDFKKAEAFFAAVDKAFDQAGPVEAMKTAGVINDDSP